MKHAGALIVALLLVAAGSKACVGIAVAHSPSIKDSLPDWRPPVTAPQGAPNIVVIMLDDVGFGDTSVFGGPARTPALDKLAAQGLRYNHFHTTSICSPTRAALLSGRNHHRVGYGGFGGVGFPGYDGIWKKNVVPLAEVLRRNGYSTAAFGKWHNTPYHEITPAGPFDRWPTGLGFEYYYGNMLGVSSQWEPPLWRNTLPVAQPYPPSQGYHFTTDLVDDAIRWFHTHESLAPDKPFFLYFATGAAHTPHHVPKAWIDQYRGRFDQGWDELRKETFAQQKKLGVIPSSAELTSRPKDIAAWDSLSSDERRLFARQMEVFAAFVAHTDHEIGRLIQTVQSGPQGENTLIIYIVGDNGDDSAGGTRGTDNLSAGRSAARSVQDQLRNRDNLGGPLSNTNHYANGWSWAGSTPFQWMKYAASHFGGTRNPLVVFWPARIKDRGGLRSQFTHVIDVAATIYEVTGIRFPTIVDGMPQIPLDGTSFAYTFEQPNAPSRHRIQYFETVGNRALYQDGWMASALHTHPAEWPGALSGSADFAYDRWELYNLAEDFSQAYDVASRYPKKLKELQLLFDRQARANQVYPLGAGSKIEFRQPRSPQNNKYVYYSEFPGVPAMAAPDFQKSHRVFAEVFVPEGGAQGVIVAWGGRDGGFAFYVKNRRLVYENNYVDKERTLISTHEIVPTGHVKLGYSLARSEASSEAIIRLYIGSRQAGEGKISDSSTFSLDNFDIGQDSAAPVSKEYQPPFRFSGSMKKVVVDLGTRGVK